HINLAHVLAAGFSVGGNAAAYLATHEATFTDLAVLHGHVVAGTIGPRRPRAWVSAGDRGRVRTVAYLRGVTAYLGQEGVPKVELRVFRADHPLPAEDPAGLVAWWLSHRGARSHQPWPSRSVQAHAVYPRAGRLSRLSFSPPSLARQKAG